MYEQFVGAIIETSGTPALKHLGILGGIDGQGTPWFIENSKSEGKVIRSSLLQFSGGSACGIAEFAPPEYRIEIVRRALAKLGAPYGINYNEEDFVKEVYSDFPRSPQPDGSSKVDLLTMLALTKEE